MHAQLQVLGKADAVAFFVNVEQELRYWWATPPPGQEVQVQVQVQVRHQPSGLVRHTGPHAAATHRLLFIKSRRRQAPTRTLASSVVNLPHSIASTCTTEHQGRSIINGTSNA